MIDMTKVAKNIKNARTKKNMTQLELADMVGVSYQAVSNWERGNSMPDIAKITDIAKALDISVSELLGEDNGSDAIVKVIEKSEEPLSSEELATVAPILPPKNLEEEINKTYNEKKLNINALLELAPFLDDEYLDELIKKEEVSDINDIVKLAPFLSDETLDDYVEKIGVTEINSLVKLAPFLSDETLDDCASKISLDSIGDIAKLAPFLSDEALDSIVDKAIAEGKTSKLTRIACFLEDDSLRKIADYILHSGDVSNLSEFAKYM
jgi:transcriptional regulator with XRE-family HTH domain